MLYKKHFKKEAVKNVVLFTFTFAITLFITLRSCSKNNISQYEFPVGIWQGTFDEKPFTLEFKDDGCMIIISEAESSIGFGKYTIDMTKQPGNMDLEFIEPEWDPFITLIEKVDDNTFRTELVEHPSERLTAFSDEAIIMKRVKNHVVPHLKTVEQRDKELEQFSFNEFETKDYDEILDICEVLFRYQFMHNASAAQQNAAAYYLSIDQEDPPKELIDRFQNEVPPVKTGSLFQEGSGLKFRIDEIKWKDKNNVEIEGGYYEGNLSASGNTYYLQKKNGAWQVTNVKGGWIS